VIPVPNETRGHMVDDHLILTGLSHEWDLAVGDLAPDYRRRLRRPLFRLADMADRLGVWDPVKREICLNRRLAVSHAWDDVRDVLLHEMAHQLAQTLPGGDGQTAHGPAFQEACLLLRADPSATAARQPLHDRIAAHCSQTGNPLRQRIRKLLSLAQSRNVHEAEAAMRKAHALMARHHITTLETDPARSFTSVFLGLPALRHFKETYFLANFIQDFYFVQGVWVPAFVVSKGKMGRALEISGTPINISQASYVFDFVQAYVERRWQRMTSEKRLTRHQKSDFAVGIIEGFRHKLEKEQLPDCRPDQKALVRQPDPRLTRYLHWRHPRTSRIQRGGRQDQDIFRRGFKAGEEMVLYRGIAQPSRNSGRKLPPA
jgi:hypothetical protein